MIETALTDRVLLDRLSRLPADGMDLFLLDEGRYRGAVVHAGRMVNQMRANHQLDAADATVLARAYVAAALLSSNTKGHDRLSLHLDGAERGFVVEATAGGEIRGYLKHNAAAGTGDAASDAGATLTITRSLESAKAPFSGQTRAESGDLAVDLATYFTLSEQIPTAVTLSICLDVDGRIVAAAGLLVQALPGAVDATTELLDGVVRSLPRLGDLFMKGDTAASIIGRYFEQFGPRFVGSRPVEFGCRCSKQRLADFITALPAAELQEMAEQGPFPLAITCHNCNSTYHFARDEVIEFAKKAPTATT